MREYYDTPYGDNSRREQLRYQKKYFPDALQKKGGLLTEEEVEVRLLEAYRNEIEMKDNIGGG